MGGALSGVTVFRSKVEVVFLWVCTFLVHALYSIQRYIYIYIIYNDIYRGIREDANGGASAGARRVCSVSFRHELV